METQPSWADLGGQPTRTGGRALLQRMTSPDSYGLVLLLLVVDFLLLSFTPANEWWAALRMFFVAATLLLAIHVSRPRRPRLLRVAVPVTVAALLMGTVSLFVESKTWVGVSYLLLAFLIIITPFVILGRILHHERVTAETLLGALCVYILIGLTFCFFYLGINGVSSQPFFAQGPSNSSADYVYFSFVALTTTGFGDLTAAGDLGRALVVLEAVLAQIYLVTTVARLVSLFRRPGAQQRSVWEEESGTDEVE